jgi:hypothetical protein
VVGLKDIQLLPASCCWLLLVARVKLQIGSLHCSADFTSRCNYLMQIEYFRHVFGKQFLKFRIVQTYERLASYDVISLVNIVAVGC